MNIKSSIPSNIGIILSSIPILFSQKLVADYGLTLLVMFSFFIGLFVIFIQSLQFGFNVMRRINLIPILCVLWLLVILIVDFADGGVFLKGYKIALPIIIMLICHDLAKSLNVESALKAIWMMLLIYIIITFISHLLGNTRVVNVAGLYSRMDIAGSVTGHAVLCCIFIMFSISSVIANKLFLGKKIVYVSSLIALYMMFQTGNRQSILILLVFSLIAVYQASNKKMALTYAVALFFSGGALFSLYTIFIDDGLFFRLFELDPERLSSGRVEAMSYWLSNMDNWVIGHGLGYIANVSQNVWGELGVHQNFPHNEFIRFFIEGGVLGFLLITVLIAFFLLGCYDVIRNDHNKLRVLFSASLFSIVIVMSLFDNLFFDMYKSNFYILLGSIIWADFRNKGS